MPVVVLRNLKPSMMCSTEVPSIADTFITSGTGINKSIVVLVKLLAGISEFLRIIEYVQNKLTHIRIMANVETSLKSTYMKLVFPSVNGVSHRCMSSLNKNSRNHAHL